MKAPARGCFSPLQRRRSPRLRVGDPFLLLISGVCPHGDPLVRPFAAAGAAAGQRREREEGGGPEEAGEGEGEEGKGPVVAAPAPSRPPPGARAQGRPLMVHCPCLKNSAWIRRRALSQTGTAAACFPGRQQAHLLAAFCINAQNACASESVSGDANTAPPPREIGEVRSFQDQNHYSPPCSHAPKRGEATVCLVA